MLAIWQHVLELVESAHHRMVVSVELPNQDFRKFMTVTYFFLNNIIILFIYTQTQKKNIKTLFVLPVNVYLSWLWGMRYTDGWSELLRLILWSCFFGDSRYGNEEFKRLCFTNTKWRSVIMNTFTRSMCRLTAISLLYASPFYIFLSLEKQTENMKFSFMFLKANNSIFPTF